jgi:hypothetical protein
MNEQGRGCQAYFGSYAKKKGVPDLACVTPFKPISADFFCKTTATCGTDMRLMLLKRLAKEGHHAKKKKKKKRKKKCCQ